MERVKSGFMQCQAGNHDHLDFICYLCAVAVWCERERGVCVCVFWPWPTFCQLKYVGGDHIRAEV